MCINNSVCAVQLSALNKEFYRAASCRNILTPSLLGHSVIRLFGFIVTGDYKSVIPKKEYDGV